MTHPLDRPAWTALQTRQQALARGEGAALRYDGDYAIFAATGDHAPTSLAALGALIAATGPAIVLQRTPLPPVPGTQVAKHRLGVQMVAEALAAPAELDFVSLGDADAAEMLALAMLTEPGPFFAQTHRLGDFIGIRDGGRLVAMAGERMKPVGFTEVSGVCTHPDWRGRGYAGGLMQIVAARIAARGETPFLHAYADNAGAIALYEKLGFRLRCEVHVTVLEPAS
ncbi:GNAT family N-acetyltransferase [Sphingomonas psychrotolerans]|uniref:GNAT family N-acetyltransferase n=1 Tax=Sphingomonas psychrotolerans TaxID=1327635 RepID=A0ABU3N213_9SPHN|nr:GNAT family N-acetyltransferase [Sphingomonas psychrotolerans]MDT8758527.1 GNAT family N-acetyltransferase [Sphingomonas psychrotolerans]